MFLNIAIGVSCGTAGVKIFGEDRVVYWREAAAGHDKVAYFLGVVLASCLRILVCSLHFTCAFHIFATPRMSFAALFTQVSSETAHEFY